MLVWYDNLVTYGPVFTVHHFGRNKRYCDRKCKQGAWHLVTVLRLTKCIFGRSWDMVVTGGAFFASNTLTLSMQQLIRAAARGLEVQLAVVSGLP